MANEDLILEILKRLQADNAEVQRRLGTIDTRLAALGEHLKGVLTALGGIHADLSQINGRVARIERRLDLDPPRF